MRQPKIQQRTEQKFTVVGGNVFTDICIFVKEYEKENWVLADKITVQLDKTPEEVKAELEAQKNLVQAEIDQKLADLGN